MPTPNEFTRDGVTYVAEVEASCDYCAFDRDPAACLDAPACNADERDDGRMIVWIAKK